MFSFSHTYSMLCRDNNIFELFFCALRNHRFLLAPCIFYVICMVTLGSLRIWGEIHSSKMKILIESKWEQIEKLRWFKNYVQWFFWFLSIYRFFSEISFYEECQHIMNDYIICFIKFFQKWALCAIKECI